ncbi:MATE family efflux transporter [Psychromonas algicola]|uniref:MATE family efflux transporter n=1 Tax=Psychromonas algicola TaxID=2555642 RepID=UPI0010679EE4|nr:MATE family efflux transporter [Psychromonas sp. RZ5]TEW52774.1 MATE family efflux transporter [Psychromonas sp. RZ5]
MKPALDLHKDPIRILIFKMTTPMMVAGFVTTSYGFVDMIFASRLGSLEVASIAFVTPLFIMLKAFASGVTRGGVSIIATLLGEEKKEKASAYATQLRLLIIVLSIIFAIPGVFLLPAILKAVGVSTELYNQALIYSQILFFSVPAMLIFQLYISLFKSQGKMKVISTISILGIICNAILNAVFLYIIEFKIDGLAYATLLTSAIQMLIILYLYGHQEHQFNIGWRTSSNYSKAAIWTKLLKVGLPLSFTQASSHFGFLVLNVFIVQFGHQAVAAFAIGNRINSLLFSPAKEIGGGLIPLIAQNWGRGAIDRVKETIKLGLLYSLIIGISAAFLIQLIKYPIAHFLTKDDPETYQHVINYVGLVGWTAIAWAVFHALQGIVNSFQKTMFTLVVNTVRLWGIRIPGILLFYAFLPSVAEYGIWYTMFLSNTITVLFAIAYFMMIVPPMLNKKEEAERIKARQKIEELIT